MREPIVDSINSALAAVLQTVQTPGDFFAAGECALHLPLIEVEGIGPIALPLLPAQAAQLIAAAERAPYGRGADTLVDTAVRRTWQIGADRVRIQGRHWPAMLDGIVERAAIGLGAGIGVEAELYRLLVYDEGGFFLEHRDTEKSPGMFGSLIVALPSLHTGGELVIRHRGREARLELRCADVSELAWAAFYADCVHEVLPITSGCRLVLVYNLRWGACCADGAKSRREPTRTGRSSWSTRWRTPTRRPSCRLRHSSADAAAATVLTTAAGGAGCDLHLALLRIEESGAAEYNDSAGPRWRSRYHDDDDDSDDQSDDEFRVAEVFDRSLTLSDWNRPDGGVAPLGTLPFSAGEICPPDSLGDMEAIDASNRLLPTGRIDTAGPRLYIRLDADLADPQALAALPIRAGDKVLRLADIATIRRGLEEPPSYLARARGQDAVLVGVVMNRGDNGQALGQRLDAWLQAERAALPLGMELTQLTNQADAIRKAVDLFQIKFLVAVAVVMGVSMLAIGLRAGLIVGIAVPVTLGVSFVVMLLMGINLDRITLGALIISLGLLVDDAIIAVEMMLMKIEEGWDKVRAAAHAWNVTAAPMLFGTLVTVAGFLPIGFARSGVGEYAGNIFWVLAVSLVVSWLVAVVFVPYLGVKMLRQVSVGEKHSHQAIYDTPLYRRLRALVAWCVRQRKTVVFGTVALLVLAGVGMATVVQKQFFPSSDRPEVLVGVYLPQGTAVAVTDATVRRLEAIMAPMPEVKTLSAYVGAGAPRFFISANPEPPNPAFGKLIAVAQDETARDKIIAVLEQHIRDGEFPEARVRVQRLLYGPPVIWPVQFRVFGPDPNGVRELAYRVREVMAANPHVVDAHLEWDERVPVLHLRTDADRLRLMGFTPQDVAQQLQLQLDGAPVTQLRRDTRTVDLVARGGFLGRRPDPQALAGLELLSREGRKVPAAQLGTLEVRYEEPVIKRYNREPFVAVQGEIRGAQPNDVTAAVWQALESVRNELPAGYRVAIGGSVEQSAKGEASIAKLQPVMVVAMLLFILLQMRAFSGTFMVVARAPLGLIGAARPRQALRVRGAARPHRPGRHPDAQRADPHAAGQRQLRGRHGALRRRGRGCRAARAPRDADRARRSSGLRAADAGQLLGGRWPTCRSAVSRWARWSRCWSCRRCMPCSSGSGRLRRRRASIVRRLESARAQCRNSSTGRQTNVR